MESLSFNKNGLHYIYQQDRIPVLAFISSELKFAKLICSIFIAMSILIIALYAFFVFASEYLLTVQVFRVLLS